MRVSTKGKWPSPWGAALATRGFMLPSYSLQMERNYHIFYQLCAGVAGMEVNDVLCLVCGGRFAPFSLATHECAACRVNLPSFIILVNLAAPK